MDTENKVVEEVVETARPVETPAPEKKPKKHSKTAQLEEKLAAKEEELAALTDQYQRMLAEYANYKRRTEQEKLQIGAFTKAEILAQCPDISQVTVQRALKDLLDSGDILKISGGRYTAYVWNWEKE